MSMKNSTDTMGNRTRDLPACSAVPQLHYSVTLCVDSGMKVKMVKGKGKGKVHPRTGHGGPEGE
jgi:hypothetical protein